MPYLNVDAERRTRRSSLRKLFLAPTALLAASVFGTESDSWRSVYANSSDQNATDTAPTAMPYVNVGNENSSPINLYYEDHGEGRPIVLISGYPLGGASWERQIPVLLDNGFRVITYDRRGFGQSSKPTIGYNFDTLADDLAKLVDYLGLHDFILVGFSMGGGEVARYIGRNGTNNVSKVMFISSLTPYLLKTQDNPEGLDQSVPDGIQKAITTDRYSWLTGFFKNFYNTDVYLGTRVSEQVVQANWNIAASASAYATYACVFSQWHEDFRKDLERINIPTLVMYGDADRLLPPSATAQRTARIVKSAQLEVVKNGPHCITWTHADEVNSTLIKFLTT